MFWLGLFLITWVLSTYSFSLYKAFGARWIIKFPKKWEMPLADTISDAMKWLVEDASLFSDANFLAPLTKAKSGKETYHLGVTIEAPDSNDLASASARKDFKQ